MKNLLFAFACIILPMVWALISTKLFDFVHGRLSSSAPCPEDKDYGPYDYSI